MSRRIPLAYTFGNHMHWVDMQWLWGYHVMPGSTHDMIRFCQETGSKGNVNFDGIGYEKMAAEAPEALAALKQEIQSGRIEPVGCSYGQPYGLFHGGESNVRQRIYGVRTVRRLFGFEPKTFWEEEFDFFPQLPQMLKGVGMEFASLYFQWTWHTPEVPMEEAPVVWWEGLDGSRLKCATRNRMNLHQWPEDFQILLDQLAAEADGMETGAYPPLILQWLELMPSKDWMCRSELMIPKLKELLSDERFDVTFATLGEYLSKSPDDIPVRRYSMGDVWHGMSLGKNADNVRISSARIERQILAAEAMATTASLMGRPYAQWDVYPVWELEEAWRESLQAQHHDIDECEGLCGSVGKRSYERAKGLSDDVIGAQNRHASSRVEGDSGDLAVFNSLGWHRILVVNEYRMSRVLDAPPMSWISLNLSAPCAPAGSWRFTEELATYTRGAFSFSVRLGDGAIMAIGPCESDQPLFEWEGLTEDGEAFEFDVLLREHDDGMLELRPRNVFGPIVLRYKASPTDESVELQLQGVLPAVKPGYKSALKWRFNGLRAASAVIDQPYSVDRLQSVAKWTKKYPTGDWMTSPQWFETGDNAFTSTSFVDFTHGRKRLQVIHEGAKQWFADEGGVSMVLHMNDPWDEAFEETEIDARFTFRLHDSESHAKLWRRAQEAYALDPIVVLTTGGEDEPIVPIDLQSSGSSITAFYREAEDFSGRDANNYAGDGMGYPFVVRLVEFNGEPDHATLDVYGTVAKAYKTNLLGEIESELMATHLNGRSDIRLDLRPHEIATVYLDIVEGRKVARDLDAKREIWATVHRVDEH